MRISKKNLLVLSVSILCLSQSQASWNGDEKSPDIPLSQKIGDQNPRPVQQKLIRYRFQGGMAHGINGQVLQNADGTRHTNIMCDGEIQGHQGNQIVWVHPFPLDENPNPNFQGDYSFLGDLPQSQILQGLEDGRLLYSDGKNYFIPHITQEKWENDQKSLVGFLIASFNLKGFTNPLPHSPQLPKGLHVLWHILDKGDYREEIWKLLGSDIEVITPIRVPSKTSSVPGFGKTAPRLLPMGAGVKELEELRFNLSLSDQSRNRFVENDCEGNVFLIGHAGAGKSSLMHLLCGKGLVASPDDIGYLKVSAQHALPEVIIQDGGEVGTKSPVMVFDPNFKRALWDCAGFEDPRGEIQEIINAYTLAKLFKGNIKLILVVAESDITDNRGAQFLKRLKKIQEMFPQKQELKESLSLVISRGQLDNPVPLLQSALNKPSSKMTSDTKELIEALLQNQHRIATFPKPKKEGDYELNTHLSSLLNNRQYVPNPVVKPVIGSGAELMVLQMAEGLNEFMSGYLHHEGLRQMISYCRARMDQHVNTAANLRQGFGQILENLGQLRDREPASPLAFMQSFKTYINIKVMEETIKHLEFLQSINPAVTYRTGEWRTALTPMIDHVYMLTRPVQATVICNSPKILRVQGIFLGMSDIWQAFQANPGTFHLHGFALNTLYMDLPDNSPFVAPGVSMSLIAPKWQEGWALKIHLSGVQGTAGAGGANGIDYQGTHGIDGQPGYPGQSGGHFYGQAFAAKNINLTIESHGGVGGTGGPGGYGGAGHNGVDATRSPNATQSVIPGWKTKYSIVRFTYHANGTDGAPGGNGGRGGHGGPGGQAGSIHFKDMDRTAFKIANSNGHMGTHGTAGPIGKGGKHGYHTRYHTDTTVYELHKYGSQGSTVYEPQDSYYVPVRGFAPDGVVPGGYNSAGMRQVSSYAFVHGDEEKRFAAWYFEMASKPTVSEFVRVFPHLNH